MRTPQRFAIFLFLHPLQVLIFLLCVLHTNAQYPSMKNYAVDPISKTTFQYNDCGMDESCYNNQKRRVTEIPPWMMTGRWHSYFFDDGRKTYIWSSPNTLIGNSTIDLKNNSIGPFNATYPYILTANYSPGKPAYNWKRNYDAIYSAQYINHPVAGTVSIAFCHGENKNEVFGTPGSGTDYQNTIQSNTPINYSDHATYSGGNPYKDGWDAYNAIVSACWTPNNHQTNWGQEFFQNDLGPIVWPSMAYMTSNNKKTTIGLRHPSSIINGNYIYIYYIEGGVYKNWTSVEEGRQGGVKLARVLVSDALDPDKYQTFYKDPNGNETWNQSLPNGLTKDNMLSYVSVKGPKSSDVLNGNAGTSDVVRFSAARVRNTNYFIGVEQYHQWGSQTYYIAIRFSSDLLTWSPRQIIYSVSDWDHSKLNYPIFLDKTGSTNNEIDADDFYIIGSENSPKDYINKLHVYKSALQQSSGDCPPNVPCVSRANRDDQNLDEQFNLTVMPNPVSNTLSIHMEVPEQTKVLIKLYSTDGKLVQKLDEEIIFSNLNLSYDISRYASGVYYLELATSNNHIFKKIIKL